MSAGVQWYFKIDGDSDVFLVKHDVALLRWQSVVTNPCVCYMYLSDVSLCVCVCACVIVCFFSVGMGVSFWLWATFDGSESGFLKLWKWSQITQQLILFNLIYSLEMTLKSGNISGNFEAHLSSRVIWVLYRLDHLILSLLLNKRDERERHNAPSRPVDVKLLSEQCPVMPDSRFYCYSLLTSLNFIKPCYLEPPSSSQTFLHKHHHLHYHYHHHVPNSILFSAKVWLSISNIPLFVKLFKISAWNSDPP